MLETMITRLKRAAGVSSKPRRGARRRAASRKAMVSFFRHEAFPPVLVIALGVVVACALLIGLSRQSPHLSVGRTMDETRTVRMPFSVTDPEATQREREMRRRSAPRVYRANEPVLDQIDTSIRTLPEALSAAETYDQVAEEYRVPFALDEDSFEVIRAEASSPESLARWDRHTTELMSELRREVPLLSKEDYQALLNAGTNTLLLVSPKSESDVPRDSALMIQVEGEVARQQLEAELGALARSVGFFGDRAQVVVDRLMLPKESTFIFDREATLAKQTSLAEEVEPVTVTYAPGDVIYRRGERLDEARASLAREESRRWWNEVRPPELAMYWAGALLMSLVLVTALVMYLGMYYPRVLLKPWRFLAICLLMLGATTIACWGSADLPGIYWLTLTAPIAFAAMMVVVAYDVRMALGIGSLMAMTACVALSLPLVSFAALWAGVSAAAWRLHEIRNRSDVVRASVITALTFFFCVLIASLVGRPLGTLDAAGFGSPVLKEIAIDALAAGAGGFLAGALTLVVLPTVERLFDIVTGMTLSEWRDPRQPLLRELQNHAPGTFNHSHTVATLAETAADAIGADSLHVYVGALYHDIGKMNKPEYFVENQGAGPSKHSKLSPAMSLLVIVGHVKDGLELAREYGLPRSLHHYIESHHGTTLVEYFFDRAKKQANQDDQQEHPSEVEYRYPGPKPSTKEAAILMLCDAVESATRAMGDPTPSRIGALVHGLATKRLVDGQFDECNLTLGELSLIEDAVTKALCSIYHGRIAYPSDAALRGETEEEGSSVPPPETKASGTSA